MTKMLKEQEKREKIIIERLLLGLWVYNCILIVRVVRGDMTATMRLKEENVHDHLDL